MHVSAAPRVAKQVYCSLTDWPTIKHFKKGILGKSKELLSLSVWTYDPFTFLRRYQANKKSKLLYLLLQIGCSRYICQSKSWCPLGMPLQSDAFLFSLLSIEWMSLCACLTALRAWHVFSPSDMSARSSKPHIGAIKSASHKHLFSDAIWRAEACVDTEANRLIFSLWSG